MAWAGLVSLVCVAMHLWQDGENRCNDGDRYTSGLPQPSPFHRRWCGWPRPILQLASLVSLVALGALMGTWKHALLFCTLPGFWFCAVHLTCVDAPAMLLAVSAACLAPSHPYAACLLSCLSGFVHERGPVFAALYSASPLLLVGLVAVGWWRAPVPVDRKDPFVAKQGLLDAIKAHRPYTDWLDWKLNALSLRGVLFMSAYYGAPPHAWLSLAVAWASRLVGTDGARFIFWGAPILIRTLPEDLPMWMVAAHAITFRRMI